MNPCCNIFRAISSWRCSCKHFHGLLEVQLYLSCTCVVTWHQLFISVKRSSFHHTLGITDCKAGVRRFIMIMLVQHAPPWSITLASSLEIYDSACTSLVAPWRFPLISVNRSSWYKHSYLSLIAWLCLGDLLLRCCYGAASSEVCRNGWFDGSGLQWCIAIVAVSRNDIILTPCCVGAVAVLSTGCRYVTPLFIACWIAAFRNVLLV